jgi:hypothetical protein
MKRLFRQTELVQPTARKWLDGDVSGVHLLVTDTGMQLAYIDYMCCYYVLMASVCLPVDS